MSSGAGMPMSRGRTTPTMPMMPTMPTMPTMPPRTMPGAPVNPRVGMAAGGYIPEAGFGQSPYNMGMNQLDPYSPMPTYLAQNSPNFVNRAALGGGGTVGYAAGGEVGYAPGGFIPQAQYPAMPPMSPMPPAAPNPSGRAYGLRDMPPAPQGNAYGLASLVNRGMQ